MSAQPARRLNRRPLGGLKKSQQYIRSNPYLEVTIQNLRRIVHEGILLLILLIMAACGTISPSNIQTVENTSKPSTLLPYTPAIEGAINMGGYALSYQCFGEGTPIVIVEAGGGDQPIHSLTWKDVIQNIQSTTRICIYNRIAGVRTSQEIAQALHILLGRIPLEGPYVIVAHSIGGYHARVFTHLYPEDVVGMILVDTTTLFPESMEAFATAYPTYFPDEASGITKNRILETDIYATLSPDMGPDGLDISASSEQVRQARSFGDLPLIVICHNITPDDWPGLDLDISERYAATARRLQAELASLSSRGEFIIARTKNHFISVTEPQIIIDAIDGMVEEIRNN